jgi:hypothetical protein
MTRHAYPSSAMVGDYLRAAAGFVPVAAILATTSVGAVSGTILGGFALLFSVFGIRTALRHGTRVEMTEEGLRASGPLGRAIAWDQLDGLKLAYYSTRRDRRDGWMQLELRAGPSTLRMDSRIDGFNEVVARAARAGEARGLALDPATAANLEALGLRPRLADFGFGEAGRSAP